MSSALKRKFVWIIGLFLISLLVRLPHLSRPLSKHHEFCSAHVLLTLKIWEQEGASKFFYSPVANYGKEADLGINNITMGIVQRDDRFYYLSFPPFGFMLPHFVFSALGVDSSPLGLRLFNIFFHFVSAYFVYLIICSLCGWREEKIFAPALAGMAVYLLAPATLWFHGNVYMSDIFVANWLIIGVWAGMKILGEEKLIAAKWLLGLGLITFLMTYTAWLGCLFAFSFFCLSLWMGFRHKDVRFLAPAASVSLGVLVALTLTFWQFSLIDGVESFLLYLENRFLDRGFVEKPFFGALSFILRRHLLTGYLPILLWLLAAGGLLFFSRKMKSRPLSNKAGLFWFLSLIPILLHHFIFINYTAVHDFALLKTGLPLAVLVGFFFYRLSDFPRLRLYSLVGILLLCIAQYYLINRPGEINQNGDRYDYALRIGEVIKEQAQETELVFMSGYKPSPQILYYAGRNIFHVQNVEEARKISQGRGVNGFYVEIENKAVKYTERVGGR